MKRIVIIGASGHGHVAADIAKKIYDEIVFLDDYMPNCKSVDSFEEFADSDFFIAIGNNLIRKNISKKINSMHVVSLIHPSSIIGSNVHIGKGSMICAGAIVGPNVTIGEGCILNTMSSVEHESILGDYVHVSVGGLVCGNGKIGDCCMLGAGSVVINNISIASHSIIGAGCVVVKNIEQHGTYVGVPAKKIK